MSVASREAAGWVTRAAWYFNRGLDRAEFVGSIGDYAPGESYLTYNRLWELGRQAALAGRSASEGGGNGIIKESAIPGRGPGLRRFKYTILVDWVDLAAGRSEPATRTIFSDWQMTTADLTAAAERTRAPGSVAGLRSRSGRAAPGNFSIGSIEVLAIEGWA